MGAFNIIGGIGILTGGQYTVDGENVSELVYGMFPNLQVIDVIYGLACMALGAFQIFTRFQLSSYKSSAPACIMAMYIVSGVLVAVYNLVVIGFVSGEIMAIEELVGQAVGSIVGSVVMVILNKVYFDKRKYLFIN